jgi:hypothetical protein
MRILISMFFALGVYLAPADTLAQVNQGRWTGTAHVNAPGCGADVALDGEIRGNQFRGQGHFPGAAPGFDWSVTGDGGVHGGGMQGRITGNRLSGSWQRQVSGRLCSYRIEMTRR